MRTVARSAASGPVRGVRAPVQSALHIAAAGAHAVASDVREQYYTYRNEP
jgi:hypothetical protein